jgi:glycosyltransferase involved in cell wall biosynthesis
VSTCIVVPHYDHLEQFGRFLPGLADIGLPIIVVDDASPAATADALEELLSGVSVQTSLVRHSRNRGKGGAVMTALRSARDAGYSHALQVDADGQHDCADIDKFLNAADERPDSVICGEPIFDNRISSLRYYGRFITLSLAYAETLSREIRDALCGFRLYPLASITNIIDKHRLGERMAFDPELLVRAIWAGIPLHYVPVKVAYPEDGKSHFHYFSDNAEISWMHTRLLFGMVIRLPMLLQRKFDRRRRDAAQ